MITSIENENALVYSKLQKREFSVLANDLKLSSLVIDHSSKKIDHPYNVYDLIIFGGNPGIVIQVERDSLKVVNEQNEIIYVKISEIS